MSREFIYCDIINEYFENSEIEFNSVITLIKADERWAKPMILAEKIFRKNTHHTGRILDIKVIAIREKFINDYINEEIIKRTCVKNRIITLGILDYHKNKNICTCSEEGYGFCFCLN